MFLLLAVQQRQHSSLCPLYLSYLRILLARHLHAVSYFSSRIAVFPFWFTNTRNELVTCGRLVELPSYNDQPIQNIFNPRNGCLRTSLS